MDPGLIVGSRYLQLIPRLGDNDIVCLFDLPCLFTFHKLPHYVCSCACVPACVSVVHQGQLLSFN